MIYKPLKHINISKFIATKKYEIILNLEKYFKIRYGKFSNNYNDNTEEYINYHYINSNFYKYYYSDIRKNLYFRNYNDIRILHNSVIYGIGKNDYIKNKIKENSFFIKFSNNLILKDDGKGNLILYVDDNEQRAFYDYFINKFLTNAKLWLTFDDLKYFTNREKGIYKTVKVRNGVRYYNNFIEDKSLHNKVYFENENISYELIENRFLLKPNPNNKLVVQRTKNLIDFFKYNKEFALMFRVKNLNFWNGDITLVEFSNNNKVLFQLKLLGDSSLNEARKMSFYFKQYDKEKYEEFLIPLFQDEFIIYFYKLHSNYIILNIFDQNIMLNYLFDISNIYDEKVFWNESNFDFFFFNYNDTSQLDMNIKEIVLFNNIIEEIYIKRFYYEYGFEYGFGNVFYDLGIFTITNPELIYEIENNATAITEIDFTNENDVYEIEYIAQLDENDFLYTNNPTALKNEKEYKDEKSEYKIPNYITTVGLYNEKNELVAVGRLSQPIEKIKLPITLSIKFDFLSEEKGFDEKICDWILYNGWWHDYKYWNDECYWVD